MNKIPFVAILLVVIGIPLAYGERSTEKIILECEKIYPELETLGKQKFQQRYAHHPDLRSCLTMYNDITWFSNDSDRTERLIALLGEPVIKKPVRDRFEQAQSIPQWIKDDATRWYQGKERDNVFSYGIRYMINSKIIETSIDTTDQNICIIDQICVTKNDYLKYSIKDSKSNDVISLTHTFGSSGNIIAINEIEITKTGKKENNFHIDELGFNENEQKYYRFLHPTPLSLEMKIDSVYELKATDELVFSYKNQKRDVILAWDSTKQYQEVIDKQTGVVLYAKYHDRIKKTEWVAELADTNMFSKEITIQYKGMQIPTWFRDPVKWWTEGQISDSDYLAGIKYLLKNEIMRI